MYQLKSHSQIMNDIDKFKDIIKMKKLKNYKKIRITHEDSLEDKILSGRFKPVFDDEPSEIVVRTRPTPAQTQVTEPDEN